VSPPSSDNWLTNNTNSISVMKIRNSTNILAIRFLWDENCFFFKSRLHFDSYNQPLEQRSNKSYTYTHVHTYCQKENNQNTPSILTWNVCAHRFSKTRQAQQYTHTHQTKTAAVAVVLLSQRGDNWKARRIYTCAGRTLIRHATLLFISINTYIVDVKQKCRRSLKCENSVGNQR